MYLGVYESLVFSGIYVTILYPCEKKKIEAILKLEINRSN